MHIHSTWQCVTWWHFHTNIYYTMIIFHYTPLSFQYLSLLSPLVPWIILCLPPFLKCNIFHTLTFPISLPDFIIFLSKYHFLRYTWLILFGSFPILDCEFYRAWALPFCLTNRSQTSNIVPKTEDSRNPWIYNKNRWFVQWMLMCIPHLCKTRKKHHPRKL